MLNLFPELFTYYLVAPVILRVVLGIVALNLGWLKLTKEFDRWVISFKTLRVKSPHIGVKALGITEIVGGVMLLAGAYTQLFAIIFAIIFLAEAYLEAYEDTFFARNIVFYLLLGTIAVSLLFLGGGFYAMDIPML